ncbi:MAG TPA: hypothetical protein VGF70_16265 [Solirubrobacteraceae bacterium]|jgi:hypothetical protein
MYIVIRSYSGEGASELFDALEQRAGEVKEIITTVPGFVSYWGFRSGNGGTTVTVCQDKTGTDESSRRAADWVRENVGAPVAAPSITEGEASLEF